jgi:tetratricopeptide (TPR) repeat protein
MTAAKSSPSMLAGGTLERTALAETFRNLYRDRASVRLVIAHQGEERTFWLDRGQILSAASNREAQLIGELLRKFDLAEEGLLLAAFERAMAEPGRGLGRVLAESGAVPQYVAQAAVRALAERILYETFRWAAGVFTVTPLDAPPDLPVRFDKTTGLLVLEALRRLPTGRSLTGSSAVEPRSRPVLHPDLLLRYQVVMISPEEAEALGRVDGIRHAEDVTRDAAILSRLTAIGLIQLLPAHKAADLAPASGLEGLNVVVAGSPPPTRLAEMYESQARTVETTYRRLDWSSLYGFLGVEPDVPDDALSRAIHERARLFHPDHHLKPHLAEARDALEALFQKVRQAERAFRSPTSRASYDATLASGLHETIDLPKSASNVQLRKQIAKANHSRAKVLFEQEDYFPAFEMVRQAVEFDPEEKDYWILLSRIQRKNPKWLRQSSDTVRRALKNIPASIELLWELAEACKAERNEPERIKALREILKLDSKNRRAQAALIEIGAERE